MSGGIDSSSITAIASQFVKLKTFSHVLPDHLLGKIHPFTDERNFINLVTDYCKITERHFIMSESKTLTDAEGQVWVKRRASTDQLIEIASTCSHLPELMEAVEKEMLKAFEEGEGK